MKIIAIDPGYERLGIAVMEKIDGKEVLLYSSCFITSKDLAHHERLTLVGNEVERIIKEYKPQALAIEKLFFSKNQKTALMVAETRGVILYTASRLGLSVSEYLPVDIKIAVTGYGKSDKNHIIAMVPKLVKITKKIQYDDEYDAIACGITYFAHGLPRGEVTRLSTA
ncbi:crossover junction endodeoxyribonuclease RuvC [Candidatus Parcubacteria bacterium]|nr:crossover junction endodeoxyribonuclease RuvC [Candidatus Parcubacteria bacterium]